MTNDEGRFEIQGLDEQLIFTVLVASSGYQTQFVTEVDPFAEPLDVAVKTMPENLSPKRRLEGKAVDVNGAPVFGAMVSIEGAIQNSRSWMGRVTNVEKAVVTDENGMFLLASTEDYDAWKLKVEAAGFVALRTEALTTGKIQHQIQLNRGAEVVGRVVIDGKPVGGVAVGICQVSRSADDFAGDYAIETDESGYFTFSSVVPDQAMTVYSKMEGGVGHAFETVVFTSPPNDGTLDLGEFVMLPTRTVEGQLFLPDGKGLPPDFRILLSRENAWDTQQISVDENGRFQVAGLPRNEAITLSVRIEGLELDHQRTRFQVTGPRQVAVFVDDAIDKFEIYMRPGIGD